MLLKRITAAKLNKMQDKRKKNSPWSLLKLDILKGGNQNCPPFKKKINQMHVAHWNIILECSGLYCLIYHLCNLVSQSELKGYVV